MMAAMFLVFGGVWPRVAAAYPEVDLSGGFSGSAAAGSSTWLAGPDARLGVNVPVGWCPLGQVLVAERLGLDLHVQVLAGRFDGQRTGVQAFLGLAAWGASAGGRSDLVTRLPTPVGVLLPEFGIALGSERSGSPYFSWTAPIRFADTYEIAPTLLWLSPQQNGRVFFGLSLRVS
jgi:hypothetical protein